MEIYNEKWMNTVKEVDPDFRGSIHQKLGLTDILCPTCGAHCKLSNGELICLNACHLLPDEQEIFHGLWLALGKGHTEDIIARVQKVMKELDDGES